MTDRPSDPNPEWEDTAPLSTPSWQPPAHQPPPPWQQQSNAPYGAAS